MPASPSDIPILAAVPLLTPADGVPPVLTTAAAVRDAAHRLASGSGPLAVDAERASGFRYSQRAYLIQLRRAGTGTILIDPIPVVDDMAPLADVVNNMEWILHSADQDLPCLAELGLTPARLFDTELAGRLAGFDRVGLAAIVERTLGRVLRKGHGGDDWSSRPLPHSWLEYAALDVEVLLDLREAMTGELRRQGKTEWAEQEFEHVRLTEPSAPKPDRWRRTSGIHTLRKPRQLAIVRELWRVRDRHAAARDVAPGRVLPDAAIIAAATAAPRTGTDLRALPVFAGARQRRLSDLWLSAVTTALDLPDAELPTLSRPFSGLPPANRWERRKPDAARRLVFARAVMAELSDEVDIPVENLLTPELLRRLCWEELPTDGNPTDYITRFLTTGGARPWQRELAVGQLAEALQRCRDIADRTGSSPRPPSPHPADDGQHCDQHDDDA